MRFRVIHILLMYHTITFSRETTVFPIAYNATVTFTHDAYFRFSAQVNLTHNSFADNNITLAINKQCKRGVYINIPSVGNIHLGCVTILVSLPLPVYVIGKSSLRYKMMTAPSR